MKKNVFLIALLAISWATTLHAQVPAGKLWILNEGASGARGSVGYVSYPDATYEEVAEIDGGGTSLLMHDGLLYALGGGGFGTDTFNIFVIDTTSKQIVDTLKNLGARKLAVWNNQLVGVGYQAARRVFALDIANNYNQLWSIGEDKLGAEANDLAVTGNTLWVTMPGTMGTNDSIAVVSLTTQDTLARIQVPTNPVRFASVGNKLFVQSLDYGADGLIITEVNTVDYSVIRSDTTGIASYGTFMPVDGHIWFGEVNTTVFRSEAIRRFNTDTYEVEPDSVFDVANRPAGVNTFNIYGIAHHNGFTFMSGANFSSEDTLFVWDGSSASLPVQVGVSARALHFEPAGFPSSRRLAEDISIRVWPNPVTSRLFFDAPAGTTFQLRDLSGRVLLAQDGAVMDVQSLAAGTYLLQAMQGSQVLKTARIVKQ